MDAQALVKECERRGLTLEPAGDRLRLRGPRAATEEMTPLLRSCRDQILRLLVEDFVDGPVLNERKEAIAWRLRSHLLGGRELWITRDHETAVEIIAEPVDIPVLTVDEVIRLKGRSAEAIHAILNVKQEFPDARWADAPEPPRGTP